MATRCRKGYAPEVPWETACLVRPEEPRKRKPPVIFSHMLGTDGRVVRHPLYGPPVTRLTRAGLWVVSADVGGPIGFGNPLAIRCHQHALDWLRARGADDSPVCGISYSMGTFGFGNWLVRHLKNVVAWAAILPVPDGRRLYAGNYVNEPEAPDHWWPLKGYFDHAYGETANAHEWGQRFRDFNPMSYAPRLRSVRIRLFADRNDPFHRGGMTHDFLDALSSPRADMHLFDGKGHTVDGLDPNAPMRFLRDALG